MISNTIRVIEEHLVSTSFSRLEQKNKINIGSHCEVWKYQDRLTQEFYAVKIIIQEGQGLNSTTQKEIENLDSIQQAEDRPSCFLNYFGWVLIEERHPNFEEITDIKCCIVFEMATGTLADLIKIKKKDKRYLPFEDFYRFTKTLIDGMSFLQARGITHRDIKPDNILVKIDKNKVYHIKIADFSESKVDIPNTIIPNMTIKGTPSYLSPELYYSWVTRNELEHNPYRSDVYSLGLTLLELATLEKVLDGDQRRGKEAEINPKLVDHGPFDHLINQAMKNFVNIYSNEKNIKGLQPILKNMLSYQERDRFDFQTLEILMEAERKKHPNPGVPNLASPHSTRNSNSQAFFEPQMLRGFSSIGENEPSKEKTEIRRNFSISLKENFLKVKGTANEEIEKSLNDTSLGKILEAIQGIKKIYDLELRTKSDSGPKRWFKVIERLLKDKLEKNNNNKIKNFQLYSVPSEEVLQEQKSSYCTWVFNQCYRPKDFSPASVNIIHTHQKHWDLGLSDEEVIGLLENTDFVINENNFLESFSLVLLGETSLTDLTLKRVLETLQKLQISNLRHFKLHLEGLMFTPEMDFLKQVNGILFKEKKNGEKLDNLESLHIGLSSGSDLRERGLKEIIDQQKSLLSLSLYFRNMVNDTLLIEMNESLNEGLFVHLRNLSIGLHFSDGYEPASLECKMKWILKKIWQFYSRQSEKKLTNFSFLLQGFYNFEDSYPVLWSIAEIKNISKFEIYWKK